MRTNQKSLSPISWFLFGGGKQSEGSKELVRCQTAGIVCLTVPFQHNH